MKQAYFKKKLEIAFKKRDIEAFVETYSDDFSELFPNTEICKYITQ